MSSQGRQIVLTDFFCNNNLEYLRRGSNDKKNIASTTKYKAARYELKGIEDMVPNIWSTIKGVESYQKKLNLTKPRTRDVDIFLGADELSTSSVMTTIFLASWTLWIKCSYEVPIGYSYHEEGGYGRVDQQSDDGNPSRANIKQALRVKGSQDDDSEICLAYDLKKAPRSTYKVKIKELAQPNVRSLQRIYKEIIRRTMAKLILNEARTEQYLAEPSIERNAKYELGEELLKELSCNSYRGRVEEDVIGHIAKILEILDPVEVDSMDPF
ncbi:hypothetical protein Tco_1255151 [Tanacetum coccineum]